MGNVLSALERNAVCAKSHRFLRSDGSEEQLSFADVWTRSLQRGAALRALGVTPGDRVALALQEPDAFVLSFFAALIAGAVPVPIAPAMTGRSLFFERTRHVLERARAGFLVTDATTPAASRAKLELATAAGTAGPLRVIDESLLDTAGDGTVIAPAHAAPDDLAFLQFTSGSTNRPKGVMVTHANVTAAARVILSGMQLVEDDVGACWLPLFHDMGLLGWVVAPAFAASPVVYSSTLRFARKPTRWFDDIHAHRLTVSLAPNFALGLLTQVATDAQIAAWDLSCMRVLGCGAEPIHAETVARFQSRFAACGLRPNVVLPSYGLAEATLAVTFATAGAPLRLDQGRVDDQASVSIVSCGRALGCEVDIVDAEGRVLDDGQVGELVVRGASVSPGYFEDPEATAEVFGPRGLRTGDLGYRRDSEIFICGRAKDLIILHGHNYYPTDLEQSLAGIDPRVLTCAAVAPEVALEARLVIVAEVSGALTAPARLIEAIRRALWDEHELDVTAVVLVGQGQIPRTTSGKLQRRACTAALMSGKLAIIDAQSRIALGPIPAAAAGATQPRASAPQPSTPKLDEHTVRAMVVEQLGEVLGTSPGELDVQRPFADYGLDSVKALRLTQALSELLARPLEAELLWRYPSVAQLAQHLARPEARRPVASAAPESIPSELPPLDDLSELELASLLETELASLRGDATP